MSRLTGDKQISIFRPSDDSSDVVLQDDAARAGTQPLPPAGQLTQPCVRRSEGDSPASLLALVEGMQAACEMLAACDEDISVSYTVWADCPSEDHDYLFDAGARLAREYSLDWEAGFDGSFFTARFSSPLL